MNKEISSNELLEGTDKLHFLRWLRSESILPPDYTDEEMNHIANRWIHSLIRKSMTQKAEV
jgi:hypothetical protein